MKDYRLKENRLAYFTDLYDMNLIHGVEYIIKGWEKESASGPWISLLFEDPVHGNADEPAPPVSDGLFSTPMQRTLPNVPFTGNMDEFDDDIPF